MTNIAYIADAKMLEYHRLNRHNKINFWRLSTKAFSELEVGDLVFFVSKDKRFKKDNEKGVVGFGKLLSFQKCSIKKMWDSYGILNGYSNYQDFKKTLGKNDNNKINSMFLKEVIFFSSPIYFSEFDVKISPQLESFTYINNKETELILSKAKELGMDFWSNLKDNDYQNIINKLLLKNMLQKTLLNIPEIKYNSKDLLKIKKYFAKYSEHYQYLGVFSDFIYRIDDKINIVFCDVKKQYSLSILGKMMMLKKELKDLVVFKVIDNEEVEGYL